MDDTSSPCREHFDALRQKARAAGLRGDFDEALALCDQALQWAEAHGDDADADLGRCGRSAVLIQQGRGEEALRDLQQILMRSTQPLVRHLAAYNISLHYELRGDIERSRFYIRLACDHAEQAEARLFLASSYNQIGNLYTRESRFDEAIASYQQAMDLFSEDEVFEYLVTLLNTGYCHLASGELEQGFAELFAVRRHFIRLGVSHGPTLGRLRLSFCFGYLELGKGHMARLHGLAGLRIAEACGESDLVKKALYLIGESEKLAGDTFNAYTHFARLQEEFYPSNPTLPELLLGTDTKRMINLWA